MIRGDDQQILIRQKGQKPAELLVKALQLFAVADRVAAVAPLGVKINKIDKADAGESAAPGSLPGIVHRKARLPQRDLNGLLHAVHT